LISHLGPLSCPRITALTHVFGRRGRYHWGPLSAVPPLEGRSFPRFEKTHQAGADRLGVIGVLANETPTLGSVSSVCISIGQKI
jgi:hypothetical protein